MLQNSARTSPHTHPRSIDVPAAARATSATSSGWRDPRLWIGVVLLAGSVVAGARILSRADDTTQVWAASVDLAPGQALSPDDLRATGVRFADAVDGERYLGVGTELPSDAIFTRPLAAGELVPTAALGQDVADDTVEVSIAVPAEHVPPDIGQGSRVDVWVIADRAVADGRSRRAAALVLDDVSVIDAPVVSDAFASVTSRQLVLAVPEAEQRSLGLVLAASGDDRVRVVGRG